MRKDIESQIKRHKYKIGWYVRDEFADNFNIDTYKIIQDIKHNCKTASEEEWKMWVKLSSGKKHIQEYIAINPYAPESALHLLLTTGRTYQDTIFDLAERDDLTVALIRKMMAKANSNTIESLFCRLGTGEKINYKIADVVAPVVVEEIVNSGKSKPYSVFFSALEYTSDESTIKYLMDFGPDLSEEILDKIASNKNLSNAVRNQAFDIGCNFNNLSSITPYMAQKMYESAIESAIDDGNISLTVSRIRNNARGVLSKISDCGEMGDSMIIDMMNRTYHKFMTPFTSNGEMIKNAVEKSNSAYILKYIYDHAIEFEDSLSWEKILVDNKILGKDLHRNIVEDALFDYYEKYNETGTAYKSTAKESSDLQFIACHLSKIDLNNSEYDTLFSFFENEPGRIRQFRELKDAIASSVHTPTSYLQKIQDKKYKFEETQKFLAKLNIDLRNNGLEKFVTHITDVIRFDYTHVFEMNDIIEIKMAKQIFENNLKEILDEKTKDKMQGKLEAFDHRIRTLELDAKMNTRELSKASKYMQGLQKECEVYAYIDELIDAIEEDEKGVTKETIKEER